MKFVFENEKLKSLLVLCDSLQTEPDLLKDKTLYKICWIYSGNIELIIDHQSHTFTAGQVVTLSYLHTVKLGIINGTYQAILFNDNFYHVVDNNHEIYCNGLLFNGSGDIIKLYAYKDGIFKIERIINAVIDEFREEDSLQEVMLQLLLKRLLILCCRFARLKHGVIQQQSVRFEVMRKFYALVDEYYKEKKQVQDYADMLHKSPKTLANILSAFHQPSAIKIIHNRIITEAERLLHFTSKSSKEIAAILGFEDHASFSRFFKNTTGMSATKFRQQFRN